MLEYEIVAPYCHEYSFKTNGSGIYLWKAILQRKKLFHLFTGASNKFYNLSKTIPFKVCESNIEHNRVKDAKVTCQLTNGKHYDKVKTSSYSP